MRTYVIRRLLLVVPTLFLVTIIVFAVVRMIPGDVIDAMMSELAQLSTTVDRELIRHRLGLDLPVHVQYGRWIGGVLQGDLGGSLRGDVPIAPKILARLPVTFELGAVCRYYRTADIAADRHLFGHSAEYHRRLRRARHRRHLHLSPDLLDSYHGHALPRHLVGVVTLDEN